MNSAIRTLRSAICVLASPRSGEQVARPQDSGSARGTTKMGGSPKIPKWGVGGGWGMWDFSRKATENLWKSNPYLDFFRPPILVVPLVWSCPSRSLKKARIFPRTAELRGKPKAGGQNEAIKSPKPKREGKKLPPSIVTVAK